MQAILEGTQLSNGWSNPAAWANGKVPVSSRNLDIRLDASSSEDLGTANTPFVANDVIGAATGMNHPSLFVSGFLHAHEVENLSDLHVPSSGGLTVSRDLAHIPFITVDDRGFIDVHHDLVNVKHAGIAFGSTIEVGHRLGETSFVFGISGGNLILDHPSHGALGNPFALGFDAVKIELGHLDFDAAVFIPNASSGLTGKIDLTEHGKLVYQLTEVSKSASGGVFSVGVDKSTGYNYVSYHG